jgi:pimeloyl-ACP methyl ester carboxylesterase
MVNGCGGQTWKSLKYIGTVRILLLIIRSLKKNIHLEWFSDLSNKFLKMRCGRLLVLAGTDRLDKTLTIGQMQGKFQMALFPESGHCVQEDCPEKLASTLKDFWQRNQKLLVIKRFSIPPKSTS